MIALLDVDTATRESFSAVESRRTTPAHLSVTRQPREKLNEPLNFIQKLWRYNIVTFLMQGGLVSMETISNGSFNLSRLILVKKPMC